MKVKRFCLLLVFLFALFSCKSSAPSAPEAEPETFEREIPAPEVSAGEESITGESAAEPLPEAEPETVEREIPAPEAEAAGDSLPDESLPEEPPTEEDVPADDAPDSAPLEDISPGEDPGEADPPPELPVSPEAEPEEPPAEDPPPIQPEPPPVVSEPEEAVIQPPEIVPEAPPVTEPPEAPPPPVSRPPAPVPEPAAEQVPPPSVPEEPPSPPGFLRPAEPEIIPPAREQVPVPVNPPPELPSRPRSEIAGEPVAFSRTVRATVGQLVEIPFRGTGWVYLGELGNRQGMGYRSRRLDIEAGVTTGQSFIFAAEAPGTYILKFYKRDFIQDYLINDYVQVIVGERNGQFVTEGVLSSDRERIIAGPRWPPEPASASAPVSETTPAAETESAAPEPSAQAAGTPLNPPGEETPPLVAPQETVTPGAQSAQGVPQTDSSAPPPPAEAGLPPLTQTREPLFSPVEDPAEYARRAGVEFDAGRIDEALDVLDEMKWHYPLGTDEAWWLYGQLLEANSPARDIKLALEYYRRLVSEYPQSIRVPDAQRRIRYLERYFFNIR